ncbi:MAG TPA: efflux transporter outer membrane subunit [Candidatus Acidoferrales bacterium]|nr:efflux transporter outer membrane subunit [Candidatus Acidoferrales bacterium]
MRNIARCIAAGFVFLLAGCLVGPRYQRPAVTAPPLSRGQTAAESTSLGDLPWWEVFRDDTLRKLVKTAVANNNDLRVAAQRVEQARQYRVQTRSEYFPSIGYEAGISGGENEFLGSPTGAVGERRGAVAIGIGAVWEADVWGRIRRLNEYSLANYLATEQARRGVLLSLTGGVARAYFELLELYLRLEIAYRNVKSFEESLRIFQERLEAGTASRLDSTRAEAALAMTAAAIPELERRIAIQENEIRLLLGSAPGAIPREGTLLEQTMPPEVPAGIPSQLLERRPDVLEAEMKVRAANAQIGIATAAFFPKIGLTALFGRMSSPLEDFTSGRTMVLSGAASATGPIWEGRSLRAQKRQAVAAWEETRIEYEQTVLAAFRDVSNALITREKLEGVRQRQMEAVLAYQAAVEVSMQRYMAGKSGYFEVLEAQQQLVPAENALAQTELDRRLVIVQLYEALGGGWHLSDAEWNGQAGGTPAPDPRKNP